MFIKGISLFRSSHFLNIQGIVTGVASIGLEWREISVNGQRRTRHRYKSLSLSTTESNLHHVGSVRIKFCTPLFSVYGQPPGLVYIRINFNCRTSNYLQIYDVRNENLTNGFAALFFT